MKRAREEERTESEAHTEVFAPANEVKTRGKKCHGGRYPP
jgi:hypothetical protein